MAILFKDTFTDVDATVLTAHTPDITTSGLVWKMFSTAVAKITGNQAYFTTTSSYGPAHVELNLQNFAVQAKFVTVINLSAIMLRYVDNSNFLAVMKEPTTGQITLKKRVASTFTVLWDSGGGAVVAGDTVRAEHEGTTIRVYINGVLKATVTNVTENLGAMQRVGFASPDATPSNARWDDFQIEDLATGTTLTGSATLQGVGTLTASGTMTQTGSASLQGVGTLSASGTLIVNGSASLQGVGTLSASGSVTSPNPTGSASLQGVGTLVASGVMTITGSATLQGVGTLTASGLTIKKVEILRTVNLQGEWINAIALQGEFKTSVLLLGEMINKVALEGEI